MRVPKPFIFLIFMLVCLVFQVVSLYGQSAPTPTVVNGDTTTNGDKKPIGSLCAIDVHGEVGYAVTDQVLYKFGTKTPSVWTSVCAFQSGSFEQIAGANKTDTLFVLGRQPREGISRPFLYRMSPAMGLEAVKELPSEVTAFNRDGIGASGDGNELSISFNGGSLWLMPGKIFDDAQASISEIHWINRSELLAVDLSGAIAYCRVVRTEPKVVWQNQGSGYRTNLSMGLDRFWMMEDEKTLVELGLVDGKNPVKRVIKVPKNLDILKVTDNFITYRGLDEFCYVGRQQKAEPNQPLVPTAIKCDDHLVDLMEMPGQKLVAFQLNGTLLIVDGGKTTKSEIECDNSAYDQFMKVQNSGYTQEQRRALIKLMVQLPENVQDELWDAFNRHKGTAAEKYTWLEGEVKNRLSTAKQPATVPKN